MSSRIRKIGQLDSIRAFAAFSVILYHFIPEYKLGNFQLGWIGVDVFFVISGYLITAILLEQKEFVSQKTLIIKNFIIKRALRLFPVYYLFISFFFLLMILFSLYVWDSGDWIFFYTYTQNILFYNEGWKGIQVNHLWTLAVEEQFYICWPWILILLANKWVIRFLLVLVSVTIFFKCIIDSDRIRMLTFYHFDTLGSGALIAFLFKREKYEPLLRRFMGISIYLVLITLLLLVFGTIYSLHQSFIVISVLTLSLSLLIGCYYGYGGVVGKVMNSSSIQYLGKISYGLYLFHKPIPYFLKLITQRIGIAINNFLLLFLSLFLVVIISHFSYIFIEKRFLKLKDKYDL